MPSPDLVVTGASKVTHDDQIEIEGLVKNGSVKELLMIRKSRKASHLYVEMGSYFASDFVAPPTPHDAHGIRQLISGQKIDHGWLLDSSDVR